MAMPHQVFKKKCVKELKGLFGQKRIEKIELLQQDLPDYSGPYGQIRKWLNDQKKKAVISKKETFHEAWEVKKQGHYTFALVGLPSVGKSSLVKELTNAKIDIAAYDFTTVKPFSAVTKILGAQIQLIDLPGIISGASEGKGFGKRVLGNARSADKILLIVESTKPWQINIVANELKKFGFNVTKENCLVVFTKKDLANASTNKFTYTNISMFDKQSIEEFKKFLFEQSDLQRVKPFDSNDFVILCEGCSVKDFCDSIHKDLVKRFKHALVSGSTKYRKQKVGLGYVLSDLDEIELVLKH
ncbi:MAG: TGS domain-containing protein [Candidatus Diapherotrites archaeon]|jgi:small GTP-binding protein|uniref:TGS domain-containing protein n=1 Tax=Candidatus Iainarchaeum sp. TaxID=3101447 RepID=A0A8T5GER1_9ARCH|nr:TGS domain-containing protein [Candidatus Diapherotrites archaeon]MBT7241080.1 TGS domain-containing protein [Candidatus Diapherotrites archaeon]